jgi:hypothetical protein
MNLEEFQKSLSAFDPPPGISTYLQSMWYDFKGDWDKAHQLIQNIDDKTAAHIHAYLHRKEGDIANANYWYQRAGKRRPEYSLEKEWEELVKALLI